MLRTVECRHVPEHGKTVSPLMQKVFNRERFGKPQVLAGLLLLVFLAQCLWLVAHISPGAVSTEEFARVQDEVRRAGIR